MREGGIEEGKSVLKSVQGHRDMTGFGTKVFEGGRVY